MAKNTVADWDTTAANNTDIGGINIGEGWAAADVNNAFREGMAQIKTAIGVSFQAYDADTAKIDVANTWTEPQTFQMGDATSIAVDRTGFTTNASISIATTNGTIFYGNADGTSFAVKDANTLNSTPWFRVSASAITAGSGIAFTGSGAGLTDIPASAITRTANAVGTYGFLCNDETGIGSHGPGGTVAGTSLLFAGLHIDNTAETVTMETSGTVFPSGTWQCMGRMINTGAANEKSATLWVRTV